MLFAIRWPRYTGVIEVRDYVYGRDIVTTPDCPNGLTMFINRYPSKTAFMTYQVTSGLRRLPFVGSLYSMILVYMFFNKGRRSYEHTVWDIAKALDTTMGEVVKALVFFYDRGIICEVEYSGGPFAYLLTNSGCLLAGSIINFEDDHDCYGKVGIAISENGELSPILLNRKPLVLIEGAL